MLSWPVKAARASGLFDRIVVSTDDAEIAEIAVASGAEVPFMRPKQLSGDFVATRPVVAHAIRELHAQDGQEISAACCIYPTAPFLLPHDLVRGLEAIEQNGFQYAFSACTYAYPIQRALCVRESGGVEMMWPKHRQARSQDLEEAWHDAGQFYWGRCEAWLLDKPVFESHSSLISLPRWRVHDIDTEEDWVRAELMFQAVMNDAKPKL